MSIFTGEKRAALATSVISSLLLGSVALAASTIGSNISTDGTLTVTGASTFNAGALVAPAYSVDTSSAGVLNIGTTTATTINIGRTGQVAALLGNATVAGTLGTTGLSTLTGGFVSQASSTVASGLTTLAGGASTTQLTTSGNLWVNGFATTTASNGNFATAGTLAVTGATTLSSTLAVTGASTLTGLTTISNASSTLLSNVGTAYFGGTATTTVNSAGNLTVGGTLTSTAGQSTFANASTSQLTTSGNLWVNGFATTTASNGNFATNGNITVTGTASTSKLYVGGDQNTTINGIVSGQCTVAAMALTASTTSYANCTGATGITTSYNVVVTPVSLPAPVLIQSASSTAANTIQVGLLDTGLATTTSGGIPATTVNFWAFR